MTERESGIKRPRLVLGGLLLLGAGAIVVGWIIGPGEFPSSLLLEVGVGVGLFAGLLMLERSLERSFETSIDRASAESRESDEEIRGRVEEVEESVADVQSTVARLGEIRTETADALARRRAETETVFGQFTENVSSETIDAILKEAERIDAVHRKGARVVLGDTGMRLRIGRSAMASLEGLVPVAVSLTIEDISGNELDYINWSGESVADIMLKVVEKLQALGEYSGELDPDSVFGQFVNTVRMAVDLRARERIGPGDLSPVIEAPNDQWAVTTYGVECLEHPYTIGNERLEEPGWVRQMAEKRWVDLDKFQEAFHIAKEIRRRDMQEQEEESPS